MCRVHWTASLRNGVCVSVCADVFHFTIDFIHFSCYSTWEFSMRYALYFVIEMLRYVTRKCIKKKVSVLNSPSRILPVLGEKKNHFQFTNAEEKKNERKTKERIRITLSWWLLYLWSNLLGGGGLNTNLFSIQRNRIWKTGK